MPEVLIYRAKIHQCDYVMRWFSSEPLVPLSMGVLFLFSQHTEGIVLVDINLIHTHVFEHIMKLFDLTQIMMKMNQRILLNKC